MNLKDKHIAILAEDNYQELELHYPRLRLIEARVCSGTQRSEQACGLDLSFRMGRALLRALSDQ